LWIAVLTSFLSTSFEDDDGEANEEQLFLCLCFREENFSLSKARVLEDELIEVIDIESSLSLDTA
jgi:hypothetical protein